jgi:predicted metal-dependent hydrolase
MDDLSKINALYNEGKKEFLDGKYYDAHEVWEDLWSDYYLKDRKFIQGLIQLSVSFVHLKNGNMVGAKNLLKKSQAKFLDYEGEHRSINIKRLKIEMSEVEKEYQSLNNSEEFNWSLVPKLNP